MSNVDVEKIGAVVVVTIRRPQVRNAVDTATAEELAEAFRDFEDDDESTVAVLTGADGTFCAGADLKAVAAGRGNPVIDDSDGPMGPTRMLLTKPTIAAVEGHAVAGGLELALWCDLRVAGRDAIFGVFCRRWGVPLVDGGTVRLPRMIGHSRALDMILTGRPVGADEALAMGLANRVVDTGKALAASVELAEQLAKFPQRCMRSDRMSSYVQWSNELDDALEDEMEYGLSVIRSGETVEGAKRFAEGRGRHGSFD